MRSRSSRVLEHTILPSALVTTTPPQLQQEGLGPGGSQGQPVAADDLDTAVGSCSAPPGAASSSSGMPPEPALPSGAPESAAAAEQMLKQLELLLMLKQVMLKEFLLV